MTNVYSITTKAKLQSITESPMKPEYTAKELDAFKELRSVLGKMAEDCDQSWLDCDHDYKYLMEDELDQVIKNFVENYSSKSIGIAEFDDLSGEEIAARVSHDQLVSALLEHSEFEPCDYYIQYNEIGSVSIGETEHQIDVATADSELHKCLAQMSDDDIKKFNAWNYSRVDRSSFCVYGNPCERLVLKLDVGCFLTDPAIVNSLREFERSAK